LQIKIIQPTTYTPDGRLFRASKRRMISLSPPYLTGLTPPECQVRIIDEHLEAVDFDAPCDVVAITIRTQFSRCVYETAPIFGAC